MLPSVWTTTTGTGTTTRRPGRARLRVNAPPTLGYKGWLSPSPPPQFNHNDERENSPSASQHTPASIPTIDDSLAGRKLLSPTSSREPELLDCSDSPRENNLAHQYHLSPRSNEEEEEEATTAKPREALLLLLLLLLLLAPLLGPYRRHSETPRAHHATVPCRRR